MQCFFLVVCAMYHCCPLPSTYDTRTCRLPIRPAGPKNATMAVLVVIRRIFLSNLFLHNTIADVFLCFLLLELSLGPNKKRCQRHFSPAIDYDANDRWKMAGKSHLELFMKKGNSWQKASRSISLFMKSDDWWWQNDFTVVWIRSWDNFMLLLAG